ncbi:MAG: AAA family ATPase, partial [Chloroflexi bacterium]|nr:AAA family ATPase [Chloroflexota bacterium]
MLPTGARRGFGERLRELRLAATLTQAALAERAGISARGIQDLERGVSQPHRDTVVRLAEALQLSGAELTDFHGAALPSPRRRHSGQPQGAAASSGRGRDALTGFVGRQAELDLLASRLGEARAGRGGIVIVNGEPGIGKTRLAERFAGSTELSGALVLCATWHEGEASLAYGPLAEALGTYAATIQPERLRQLLGAAASPLAELVPRVRAALPEIPVAAPIGSDAARLRLYDAVTQFLLSLACDSTLVLVLDDLQWADHDSLALLRHFARFVARARILMLGTYRDVEVDRAHPLAETLAIIRHEADYARLRLSGFSFDETAAFLHEIAAGQASQHLSNEWVRRIYDEADGSPFYTRELLHHLMEEGAIARHPGRWPSDRSSMDLGIPEGVREVVGRRLARLSWTTNMVLRQAAAFSGGFAFELLRALSGLDEDRLLDCLDEALAAGLIKSNPSGGERYDFAHAIIRHTIYDDLNPSRRLRLHRRIAQLLESLGPTTADQTAAEIAAQYHASARLPGAERGIRYAIQAAEAAHTVFAPDSVVTLVRIARDLSER